MLKHFLSSIKRRKQEQNAKWKCCRNNAVSLVGALSSHRVTGTFDMKTIVGNYELSGVVRSLMEGDGSLLPGSKLKSKLIKCVTGNIAITQPDGNETYQVAILDAMVIVQSIDVKKSKIVTCKDLADTFIRNSIGKAQNSEEIRIIFDTYPLVSLKETTRKSRNKKYDAIQN